MKLVGPHLEELRDENTNTKVIINADTSSYIKTAWERPKTFSTCGKE